jgi:hypothetical protein
MLHFLCDVVIRAARKQLQVCATDRLAHVKM